MAIFKSFFERPNFYNNNYFGPYLNRVEFIWEVMLEGDFVVLITSFSWEVQYNEKWLWVASMIKSVHLINPGPNSVLFNPLSYKIKLSLWLMNVTLILWANQEYPQEFVCSTQKNSKALLGKISKEQVPWKNLTCALIVKVLQLLDRM